MAYLHIDKVPNAHQSRIGGIMSSRKKIVFAFCAGLLALSTASALTAQDCTLANPGFEDGPLGEFNDVVSPTFSGGFWADENGAIIADGGACNVMPRTGDWMLRMLTTGYHSTETWQAVPIGTPAPASFSVSAWFNACDGIAPRAAINAKTFDNDAGWPDQTATYSISMDLDGDGSTWEELSIGCEAIPAGTMWLLIDISFVESTLSGNAGFVDDVHLMCDCPVPNARSTWEGVKSLYKH